MMSGKCSVDVDQPKTFSLNIKCLTYIVCLFLPSCDLRRVTLYQNLLNYYQKGDTLTCTSASTKSCSHRLRFLKPLQLPKSGFGLILCIGDTVMLNHGG